MELGTGRKRWARPGPARPLQEVFACKEPSWAQVLLWLSCEWEPRSRAEPPLTPAFGVFEIQRVHGVYAFLHFKGGYFFHKDVLKT